jgi:hypothetical protein
MGVGCMTPGWGARILNKSPQSYPDCRWRPTGGPVSYLVPPKSPGASRGDGRRSSPGLWNPENPNQCHLAHSTRTHLFFSSA